MSRSPSWTRKLESHNAVDFAQKRYFCTIWTWFFSLWKYSLNSFRSSLWVTVSNSNVEKHNRIIMCNFVCLVPHKSSQTLPCIPEGLQKLKSNKEWLNCRAPNNYRQLQARYFICNEHKKKQLKRNEKLMMQPISGSSGNSLQFKQFSLQRIQPLAQR